MSIESKRAELVRQASKLYWNYGIRAVTMDDIAQSMGMSKKTLYELISDKTALVELVLDKLRQEDVERFSVFNREDLNAIEKFYAFHKLLRSQIKDIGMIFFYDLDKYYPSLLGNFKDSQRAFLLGQFSGNLKEGMSDGLYRDDLNIDLVSNFMLLFRRYAITLARNKGGQEKFYDTCFIEEVFKYHLNGICSKKGRKEVLRLQLFK